MGTSLYTPGPVGPTISDETVALVRQAMADTTRAITTASGLIGYELEAPAKVVVPVITPLVNMIPRRKGVGIDVVHWKAITSFDTGIVYLAQPVPSRSLSAFGADGSFRDIPQMPPAL